jgi:hypothetical protein
MSEKREWRFTPEQLRYRREKMAEFVAIGFDDDEIAAMMGAIDAASIAREREDPSFQKLVDEKYRSMILSAKIIQKKDLN